MDEQGGAGGVPLHGDKPAHAHAQDPHRKPRADRHGDDGKDGGKASRQDSGQDSGRDAKKTVAADTDEASRLDRPQRSEQPRGKGTPRWVSPRDGATTD